MGGRPSREHEPKKMGDARPKYHRSSSSRPVRQLGQLHDSLHGQSNSRESIEILHKREVHSAELGRRFMTIIIYNGYYHEP